MSSNMNQEQQQLSTEAIWSPKRINAKLKALIAEGSTQLTVSALSEVPGDQISLWRHGWKTPRKERALAVQKTIEGLNRVLELDGRGKLNDVKTLRRRLREIGMSLDPAPIPQPHGVAYVTEFSGHMHITPAESFACMQLAARLLNASVLSAPCQRWVKAWSVAMAQELDGVLFDSYAARFPSRQEALEAFARGAFKRLVDDAGPAQIKSYMSALTISGELARAPLDNDQN